jgi:hypothetical protein
MKIFLLLLTDIVLGYLPQAAGCAICVFMVAKQEWRSRKFLMTICMFAGIAILIRLAYNFKLLDFGFHTILIWILFILVAITYDRFPIVQSSCSILLSGVLITMSELVTAGILIAVYGNDTFTAMMNNTQTIDGKIIKAICGIPTNMLFLVVVLVANHAIRVRAKKIAAQTQADAEK